MLIFVYLWKANTLLSPTMTHGQAFSIQYSMKIEWPLYGGPTIVPPNSMQRMGSGHPRSTQLHNEMDVREGKTPITCGLCKQLGHNRRSCKNRNQV